MEQIRTKGAKIAVALITPALAAAFLSPAPLAIADEPTATQPEAPYRLASKATYYSYDASSKSWKKTSSCAYAYNSRAEIVKIGKHNVTYTRKKDGSAKTAKQFYSSKRYYGPYTFDKKGRVASIGKKNPTKLSYSKQGYVKSVKSYSAQRKWLKSKIAYKYRASGLAKQKTTYNSYSKKKERVTKYNAKGLPAKVTMYDYSGGKSVVFSVTTYAYTYNTAGLVTSCEKTCTYKRTKRVAPVRTRIDFKYSKTQTDEKRYACMVEDLLDANYSQIDIVQWL